MATRKRVGYTTVSMKDTTKAKLDIVAGSTGWSQARVTELALDCMLAIPEFQAMLAAAENLKKVLEKSRD